VAFGALAVRLFRLTSQYAVNVFFWDQWDFNDAALFEHHSLWAIFRFQHGPHRQGLGGLLAALVEPWFRWNSRTEAFVATAIVVVAGLAMLYLKCRLFGPLTWTDVAIPMIVFTPAQWESAWNTVNFAHGPLPVLLIVLYCLAWTWQNRRVQYAAITVLSFVTLYTGFGVFIGLLTPVLLLARYRKDRDLFALACALLSVACLASFFVGYVNDDASGCDSLFSAQPQTYVHFLCLLFATPFGIRGLDLTAALAGVIVMVAVTAAGAAGWKRVLRDGNAVDYVLATLGAYILLFCVAATLGRTCTGMPDAHASRYTAYKELAVLAVLFWVHTWKRPDWQLGVTAILPVLLIPALFVTSFDDANIQELHRLKLEWRTCYLAGNPIADCYNQFGPIYPDPARTDLQRKLDYLRDTRQNLFADQ
jgi:hypothetical protein